jgi:catechol 2,3-dioxygenase-like lactoylglutathione lyase family enzyme
MSTQLPSSPSRLESGATVSHLHHVGYVVRNIESAIALYRRMGFVVPPPSFPALAPRPGEPVRAFGAGNTHVSLRNSFVELVTVIDDQQGGRVDADATLVPLQAPPEVLKRLTDDITQTARRISHALDRFEGLHILVFGTPDADTTVARLEAEGVVHGPVTRVQRPVGTGATAQQISIGFVEIDSEPGLSPEGRLALAEDGPVNSTPLAARDHSNGAVELVESVLCVPDDELSQYERRYSRYLQRPARTEGSLRIFDLDDSTVMIVPDSALGSVLPAEVPPDLPAFVAYGLAVRDLSTTRDVLERSEFPVRTSPLGGIFVPASAALGAAIIFYGL